MVPEVGHTDRLAAFYLSLGVIIVVGVIYWLLFPDVVVLGVPALDVVVAAGPASGDYEKCA